MRFKNLILWDIGARARQYTHLLSEKLVKNAFDEHPASNIQYVGWMRFHDGEYFYRTGNQILMQLGISRKAIPPSALADRLREAAADYAAEKGHPPGRNEKKRIKEEVIDLMLPSVYPSRKIVNVWLDLDNCTMAVDTSSTTTADLVFKYMLEAMHPDYLQPVTFKVAREYSVAMNDFLLAEEMSDGFTIDADAEIQGRAAGKPTVKYKDVPPMRNGAEQLITDGKRVVALGMTYEDKVSFTLANTGTIKKIKFLDLLFKDQNRPEEPDEMFEADFLLITGILAQMIENLRYAINAGQAEEEFDDDL